MGLDYQMLQAALKHLPHRNDPSKGEGRFGVNKSHLGRLFGMAEIPH